MKRIESEIEPKEQEKSSEQKENTIIDSIGNYTGGIISLRLEDNNGIHFTFHFYCAQDEAVHLVTECAPEEENEKMSKEWGFPLKMHKNVLSVKGLPEKNTQPIIVTTDVANYLKDHPEIYPGAVFIVSSVRNVFEGRDPEPVKYLTLYKKAMSVLTVQPEVTAEEQEEKTY